MEKNFFGNIFMDMFIEQFNRETEEMARKLANDEAIYLVKSLPVPADVELPQWLCLPLDLCDADSEDLPTFH